MDIFLLHHRFQGSYILSTSLHRCLDRAMFAILFRKRDTHICIGNLILFIWKVSQKEFEFMYLSFLSQTSLFMLDLKFSNKWTLPSNIYGIIVFHFDAIILANLICSFYNIIQKSHHEVQDKFCNCRNQCNPLCLTSIHKMCWAYCCKTDKQVLSLQQHLLGRVHEHT